VTRTYVGADEVYVPDLGRWVAPGDEVTFGEAPDPDDPRWATKAAAKKAPKPGRKVEVFDPNPDDEPTPVEAPAVTEES
jgi:hypothetical protein